MSTPDTAFATRLTEADAARVEEAIEESDTNAAAFLRRATQYYIQRNPDRLAALETDGYVEEMLANL